MSLTETWVENHERVDIPGFKPIAQFKRNTARAGGVAIYDNEASSALQSVDHELLKYDKETMEIKSITTTHDGVGDIFSIETTINNKRALILSVYITPGTSVDALEEFFALNLLAYSPKLRGIIKQLDCN